LLPLLPFPLTELCKCSDEVGDLLWLLWPSLPAVIATDALFIPLDPPSDIALLFPRVLPLLLLPNPEAIGGGRDDPSGPLSKLELLEPTRDTIEPEDEDEVVDDRAPNGIELKLGMEARFGAGAVAGAKEACVKVPEGGSGGADVGGGGAGWEPPEDSAISPSS
jgi:hypothetical protein